LSLNEKLIGMAEIPASLSALVVLHQAVSNSGADFGKAWAETACRGNSLAVVQPIRSIQEFKRAESLGPGFRRTLDGAAAA
jgi:hypothetical protein